MNKNNPYLLIDEILLLFVQGSGMSLIKIKETEFSTLLINKGITVDETYLHQILDKLVEENYIYRTKHYIYSKPPYSLANMYNRMYNLKFDGFLLLNDGNYSKMMERNIKKETEIFTIQKNQEKYSKNISCLTYWIAFGTVAVGPYTLLQIHDWLHCHHYFYYNFCKKDWIHF